VDLTATLAEMAMNVLVTGQGALPYSSRCGGSYYPGYPGMAALTGYAWPCVAAICEAPLVEVDVRRGRPQAVDANVLFADLPVVLAQGASLNVPQWLVRRNFVDANLGDGTATGAPGSGMGGPSGAPGVPPPPNTTVVNHPDAWGVAWAVGKGASTVEFRIPFDRSGGKMDALTVMQRLTYEGREHPAEDEAGQRIISLYDWTAGKWAQAGPASNMSMNREGVIRCQPRDPSRFASRDGTILVRYAAGGEYNLQVTGCGIWAHVKTHGGSGESAPAGSSEVQAHD
jgi:hypothetical protein